MSETPARKMMLGTERQLDYLIVKTREHAAVGIKPLIFGDRKRGVCLEVRVRAARLPSAPQSEKTKPYAWEDIFPEIDWYHNAPMERASCVIMIPTGDHPMAYDKLRAKAPVAAVKFIEFLSDALGGIDHDQEDAAKFLSDLWVEAINTMEKVIPATYEEMFEAPTVFYAHKVYEYPDKATTKKASDLLHPSAHKTKTGRSLGVVEGGKGHQPDFKHDQDDVNEGGPDDDEPDSGEPGSID